MHLNNTDQQHYLHVYVYSNFNTIDMLNMKVKFEIFRLVFPSPFSKKKKIKQTNKIIDIILSNAWSSSFSVFTSLASDYYKYIFCTVLMVTSELGGLKDEKKSAKRQTPKKKLRFYLINDVYINVFIPFL